MKSLTHERFKSWLDAYGQAWRDGDPDAAMLLFDENARYFETPFDPPMVGRDAIHRYWKEGAGESQKEVEFSHEILSVRDGGGVALWQASFVRIASGRRVRLDGVLLAEFSADMKCTSFREWWHRME